MHRIGQTRPTVVHRFIMDASIEENVRQIHTERAAAMDLSAAAANQAPRAEQQSLTVRWVYCGHGVAFSHIDMSDARPVLFDPWLLAWPKGCDCVRKRGEAGYLIMTQEMDEQGLSAVWAPLAPRRLLSHCGPNGTRLCAAVQRMSRRGLRPCVGGQGRGQALAAALGIKLGCCTVQCSPACVKLCCLYSLRNGEDCQGSSEYCIRASLVTHLVLIHMYCASALIMLARACESDCKLPQQCSVMARAMSLALKTALYHVIC